MVGSPTLRRRQLARELSRLRDVAGMTIEQAAESAGISMSHLSRVERAMVGVRLPVVKVLMTTYGADADTSARLFKITKEAAQRGWWHRYGGTLPSGYATYIGFESDAEQILCFDTVMVPGLAQTEAYSREIFANGAYGLPDDEIERRVEIRLQRQAILTRDDPPRVWIVLDEAAIRRQVGGPEAFAAQLDHLLDLTKSPHVDVQIIPFVAGAHSGAHGSFTILKFADPTDPPVAHIETLAGDLFPEDAADVNRATMTFDRLRATALSPAESQAVIRKALRELRNG
jgi:transcriptional regulator with XRE-family HTH domain